MILAVADSAIDVSDFVTRQAMYYLAIDDAVAAADYQIQATFPAECSVGVSQAVTLTGVDPLTPLAGTASTSQSSGVFSSVLTEVTGLPLGAFVVDAYGHQGPDEVDPTEPGQALRVEHLASSGSLASSTRQATGSSATMGWTGLAGEEWNRAVHTVVVFRPN